MTASQVVLALQRTPLDILVTCLQPALEIVAYCCDVPFRRSTDHKLFHGFLMGCSLTLQPSLAPKSQSRTVESKRIRFTAERSQRTNVGVPSSPGAILVLWPRVGNLKKTDDSAEMGGSTNNPLIIEPLITNNSDGFFECDSI